ncbi:MAG: hypothetical protein IIA17_07970 [candidate division Zixibacteria bacterium]|nr:hypothetical protein [candidate division Zixibacteria bacterium]
MPRLLRVGNVPTGKLQAGFAVSTSDTCIVRHDAGIKFRVDNWIIGDESYLSYLDPDASCDFPYPFSVTEINMLIVFDSATPLIVSVYVSEVDSSNPSCPMPGPLMATSLVYEFAVPAAGLYDIQVSLDTPIVVNGPFFAGFFIKNTFEAAVNPGLITDDIPVECVSYNFWDTAFGQVDMGNNGIYNFPGRTILYARGFPGGVDCDPADTALNPPTKWYADVDGDGYGDPANTTLECLQPSGYVLDSTDCDDTDSTINPTTVWYVDSDGDGHGLTDSTIISCTQPAGFALDSSDNCPDSPNPCQADANGDGIGDACCCIGFRGDVNGDGEDATVLDLTYMIDRIFRGGAISDCPEEADLNFDGDPATILDLTYLIDFIFRGGFPIGLCL